MKVNSTEVLEFVQFCKFVLAYSAVLTILNVVLLNKEFNLLLVFTAALPAIISYFGFKFLASK